VSWIVDVTAPVISTCASDQDVNINASCSITIPDLIAEVIASDNCSGTVTVTQSPAAGTVVSATSNSTHTVTFTATDACGNTSTCSAILTAKDVTSPTASCKNIDVNLDATGNVTITPEQLDNGSFDGCGGTVTLSASTTHFTCSDLGANTVTVTFTVTDASNNTATCTSTVTVHDVTAPVITCPENTQVTCNEATVPVKTGSATATDACDADPEISYSDNSTQDPNTANCGHYSYIITRTWKAEDASGNTSTCNQIITVTDNTAPSIGTQASNSTVECGSGNTAALNAWLTNHGGATADDECSGVTWSHNFTALSDGCGATGSATVIFKASDACGNTSTTSATFTITDVTAPVISGVGGPQTISCPATPSSYFSSPTASDGCGAATLTYSDATTPGTCANASSVKRTWTATDACGNTATACQTVYVIDNTPPVISGVGGPQTISCPATPSSYFSSPTASDGCGAASLTYSDGTTSGSCDNARSVKRTWTATDGCGNTATASQTITVVDNTPPVITTGGTTTTLGANPSASDINAALGTATASDACGASTLNAPSDGTVQSSGCSRTQTRTWTAKDACGNTSSASRTVGWTSDNTPPSITCPANMNLSVCGSGVGTWSTPSASDNCGGTVTVTQTSGPASGSVFATGSTTVITYQAMDGAGNTSTCSFTVTRTGGVTATCNTNNNALYYGFSGDQTATVSYYPSGGVAPYTVKITMNRNIICNYINNAGDEVWNGVGGSTTGNTCPSSGNGTTTPLSTGTGIAAGGSYSVNVTLMADATISATIIDANGCTVSGACPVTIHAEDARCFAGNSGVQKVTLCHKNGNACVKLCVDESAVAAHLAHGDYLGNCTLNCMAPAYYTARGIQTSTPSAEVSASEGSFHVHAYPNPSDNQFTLQVESTSNEKVGIVIYDAIGRQVKKIEKGDAMSLVKFGDDLKAGVYIVEVLQGKNHATVKLIKQ
jgi:hypothetical protein